MGVVLAVALLAGLEMFWRHQGHLPSVVDSEELWAIERERVSADNVIAILGTSRAVTGISMATLRERLPQKRPVMLAIAGHAPGSVLRNVLADRRFHGTVVVEMEGSLYGAPFREPTSYLHTHAHGVELNSKANTIIRAMMQSTFTLLCANLSTSRVLSSLVEYQELPPPSHQFVHADRSISADFRSWDTHHLLAPPGTTIISPPGPVAWLNTMATLEPDIAALRARGGDIAFVRFPTTVDQYGEEAAYPRATHWDPWASKTAAKTLHYKDVPAMADLDCPDGSHLDMRDAPGFTNALVDELSRLGVVGFTAPLPVP
jgi:hypothetical protein